MFVEDGEGMAAGEESGEDGLEVHFDTSGETELARRDYEAHGEATGSAAGRTAAARKGRFRGSDVGAGAMLTDLEPGRIPGGETPPSTAGGTPAATYGRFMESPLFEIELLTGHEPGSEDDRERPSPRPSPESGRGRRRSAGFEGLGLVLAGMNGDGLRGKARTFRRG